MNDFSFKIVLAYHDFEKFKKECEIEKLLKLLIYYLVN